MVVTFMTKAMISKLANKNSNQQEYIDQQSLLLLVNSVNKAIFAFPITCSILAAIFWQQISTPVLILWLSAVFAAAIYRAILHKNIKARGFNKDNYRYFLSRLLWLDFYSGLVLGLSGYFLLTLSLEYQWLLIIVIAAMSTNSVSAQSANKISVLAFNVPLYINYFLWLFLANDALGYALVFLLLAHAGFLFGHYKALHKYIHNSLELSYKNQSLADDLAIKNTQLVKSNQQVKAASLAKSQFIAQLSHQLKEPVKAMIDALDKSKQLTQLNEIHASINMVQASGGSLLLLFDDLIDVNRLEQGQLARCDKMFNVREHFDNLANLIALNVENKGLSIYCNIASDVAQQLVSDPLRISQITLNLLANAVKFTEQGEIGLVISSHQSQQQTWLTVAVYDTGCGIDEDKKDYVFQPFVHEVSAVERIGNGLGLAISQELVQLLGGTISVVSSLGKGSIFSYKIPVKVITQPLKARTLKIQKLLLIESNNNQRQALVNQFKYLKIAFDLVDSAKEAMALCASHNKYQVVIMGNQDRLQQKLLINLCDRIKLPTILIASLINKEAFLVAQTNNKTQILSRPIKLTTLKKTLNLIGNEL